jgi:hypothetical protein
MLSVMKIIVPYVLKIGIPFTVVGIITFVIVACLAFFFLRWWFRRRSSRTISVTKIVKDKSALQQGLLYRQEDLLHVMDKGEEKTLDIRTIHTAIVSDVENQQQGYSHYKLQFAFEDGVLLSIDGSMATQPFFNEILAALNKPTIDWTQPLPQMHKIGGMVIKGYKIAV